jgi:hypothetical protein
MTTDEIIEMARQASNTPIDETSTPDLFGVNQIVKFAKRIADVATAKEQEAIIDLVAFYGGPVDLEAAIRARGEPTSRGDEA